MQKTFNNPDYPNMKRVAQMTNSHCGPAVLEMLFSNLGITIDQNQFVMATGISHKIEEYGMTVSEMINAVTLMAPDHTFWFKENSSQEELDFLVNQKYYPVGVEWQGVFMEYSDDDDGHYGVVTAIDIPENLIKIADPFEPFAYRDRTFKLYNFMKRWWDVNEIVNPATHEVTHETDEHMMFIVTPKSETFPKDLGMKSSR